MTIHRKRKLVIGALVCLAFGTGVWSWTHYRKLKEPPNLTSNTADGLVVELAALWQQRLRALGTAATPAEQEVAAADFAKAYADKIALQQRLADQEASAPYLGRVEALSNRAAVKVRSFDEVRRKLSAGALTALPPELAPPPIPEPAPIVPVPEQK